MADKPPRDSLEEVDIEAAHPPTTGDDKFMKDFFDQVNAIKSGMATIKRNIRAIDANYTQSLAAVGMESKASDELEKLLDSSNLTAADVRNRLKEMDKQNKKAQKLGPAQTRIRTNMHGTLTRKFMDIMAEYQEVQSRYKNKFREKLERQFAIVNPDATKEEIAEAVESGDTELFAQKIVPERHAQAKAALAYIENRHKDIIRLEQSIHELHQLFVDMAVLVETQGELIDQIEYNVNQSVAYTEKAVVELQSANKLQKKSRKKMCILICILVVLLLVIAGIATGFGISFS